MPTAFILGAGLGTRLRPLTNRLPKPLVPVAHQPLLTWAMRHLEADLGTDRFVINTHHLPDAFAREFPDARWQGHPLHFRHEPILLDTGGGLANVRDLLPAGESIALYNGDILCDAPLAPLAAEHAHSDADVTMLLRPGGHLCNVVCTADPGSDDTPASGPIRDIRGLLGSDGPRYQFAGIAMLGPRFLDFLPPAGEIFSLIPVIVDAISSGLCVRGVISNDGLWSDLGTPESVLATHRNLLDRPFPRYAPIPLPRLHPDATIAPATVDTFSWVGPGVIVPPGCHITRSVLLAGTRLEPGESVCDALRY